MSVAQFTLSIMSELLTPQHVRALRADAQGLHHADQGLGADVAQVTAMMLATQGQDWQASQWAVGRRVASASRQSVVDALNTGQIVRSWPMRGTIHLVAAEDIGWLQNLTNKKPLATAPKRREVLGLDEKIFARLIDTSLAALRAAGIAGLDRNQLSEAWTAAAIPWQSNWRYHLIWWLCQNGLATLGPVQEFAEPRLVLAETWLPATRQLDEISALVELASRYTFARGPIRAKDLAWWSGLGVREVKQGLAAATEAGTLVAVTLTDEHGEAMTGSHGEAWVHNELIGKEIRPMQEALMLAPFDEHLLGYSIREPQLPFGGIERIVPGKNGVFLGTIINNDQVIGTWRRDARQREKMCIDVFPGAEISEGEMSQDVARWSAFHGQDLTEISISTAHRSPRRA